MLQALWLQHTINQMYEVLSFGMKSLWKHLKHAKTFLSIVYIGAINPDTWFQVIEIQFLWGVVY